MRESRTDTARRRGREQSHGGDTRGAGIGFADRATEQRHDPFTERQRQILAVVVDRHQRASTADTLDAAFREVAKATGRFPYECREEHRRVLARRAETAKQDPSAVMLERINKMKKEERDGG